MLFDGEKRITTHHSPWAAASSEGLPLGNLPTIGSVRPYSPQGLQFGMANHAAHSASQGL